MNRGAVVAIAVILALVIAGVWYQALFSGGGPTSTMSSSFSLLWKGPGFPAGPPIVTGDIVWVVDTSNGWLHGFEAKTGTEVFSAQTGPVTRFTTPSTASGWVIVAAGNKVYAFHL